jgi:hypothetical protein
MPSLPGKMVSSVRQNGFVEPTGGDKATFAPIGQGRQSISRQSAET